MSEIDYGGRLSEQPARRRSASLFAAPLILLAGLLLIGIWYESRGQGSGGVAWTRADLHPLTQPAPVGGRFVLYAASGGFLQVVALDPHSGSTVWWDQASTAFTTPGVAPVLAVVGGDVVYMRSIGAGAELVARDAASGSELWHSRVARFTSWPTVCLDRRDAICMTGSARSNRAMLFEFDARSGDELAAVPLSESAGGRVLGPGLFDAGERHPELLEAASGRGVAWRTPLAQIFPRPAGASTDWGWNFDRVKQVGIFVGTPGWPPVTQTATRAVLDLSHWTTAGFRISDSGVVWRSRGLYICTYVPCPGEIQAGYSSPATVGSGPTLGVRMLVRGTITAFESARPAVAGARTQATLQGFDPASGRTRWTFAAGHDVGLITQTLLAPQIGAQTIALRAPHGFVALDLATGARSPISATARAWCRKFVSWRERTPYLGAGGRRISTRVGQFGLFPCTANGEPAAVPKQAPALLAALGAKAGRTVAWSEPNQVVAVHAR